MDDFVWMSMRLMKILVDICVQGVSLFQIRSLRAEMAVVQDAKIDMSSFRLVCIVDLDPFFLIMSCFLQKKREAFNSGSKSNAKWRYNMRWCLTGHFYGRIEDALRAYLAI